MISNVDRVAIQTTADTQLIDITRRVEAVVDASGVEQGRVFINTLHTTTAITVNEPLEDLENDLLELFRDLVPADRPFRHARFLHSDGQMAVNAPSHLRGALLGIHVSFPIVDRRIVRGSRQTIYFVELDGPLRREYTVQVLGA